MHKKIILFLLIGAVQNVCFAMGPDYVGIGNIFLCLLTAIFFIFAAVGAAVSRERVSGAIKGGATFIIVLGIAFSYFRIEGKTTQNDLDEMRDEEKRTATLSVSYMLNLCATDERFTINKKLPLGSSVFINLFPEQKPPTEYNIPLVVPTPKMKEQFEKYHQSFPPMNDNQYRGPISWVKDTDQPRFIAELVKSDLVESRDRFRTYGKDINRLATKQRWEKDGNSDYIAAYTEKYVDRLKFKNWPESELMYAIPIPVDKPAAEYVFSVDDISTLDDRKNWLARGRIRLQNAKTEEVVAEYVGFQTLLNGSVCPDVAKAGRTIYGKPDILRFFFGRVTQE